MTTQYVAALAQAAQTPQVKNAMAGASAALTQLRFHEGLRRRWENARAESAVREATALALLEGSRLSVDDLRARSMTDGLVSAHSHSTPDTTDPGMLLALGIWRSQWNLTTRMSPLNTKNAPRPRPTQPLPARISALHRDVCSALVTSELVSTNEVAIPRSPTAIQALSFLINAELPALACAADVWARLRCQPLFTIGSGAVGAALAREILVERGTDPSGVAVISAWHTLNPVESAAGLDAWRAAQGATTTTEKLRVDALAQWLATFAQALQQGAEEGVDVALHIQAGRLD